MLFDDAPLSDLPFGDLAPSGGTTVSGSFSFLGTGSFSPASKEADNGVVSFLGKGSANWQGSTPGHGAWNPVGKGSFNPAGNELVTAHFSFVGAGSFAPAGALGGLIGIICKQAPFFTTDTITTAGYQLYKYAPGSSSPTADGIHHAYPGGNINQIANVTNGYTAFFACTLDPDLGYRGYVTWDSGGGSPFYVSDEVNILPAPGQILAKFQADPGWDILIANLPGTVNDSGPTVSSFKGSSGLSTTNGFYVGGAGGCSLAFTSGPLKGVVRKITGYTGATRLLAFSTAWPQAPNNGDAFIIVGFLE